MKQTIMASWNVVNPPRTKTLTGRPPGGLRSRQRRPVRETIGLGRPTPIRLPTPKLQRSPIRAVRIKGQVRAFGNYPQQMGVSLNPMDWFTSQDALDIQHGDKVLQAYYDAASTFPNFGFTDYQSYRDSVGGDSFVKSLGANVRINMHPGLLDLVYFPYDDAAKRVQALATKTSGQATPTQINQAAIDTSVDAIQAVSQAATDIVVGGAAGISNTASMLKYLPLLLVAGFAVYALPEILAVKKLTTRKNPRIRKVTRGRTRMSVSHLSDKALKKYYKTLRKKSLATWKQGRVTMRQRRADPQGSKNRKLFPRLKRLDLRMKRLIVVKEMRKRGFGHAKIRRGGKRRRR